MPSASVKHPAHGRKAINHSSALPPILSLQHSIQSFCGNPLQMTSRFVCYGIRPRDLSSLTPEVERHFPVPLTIHRLSETFLLPQLPSLPISTLLYTHYFRNASLIYPDFFFQLYCTLCPGMLFCCLFHSPHGNVSHLLFICQQVFDFYRELL